MQDKPFISESKLRIALLHRATDMAIIPFSAYIASGLVHGYVGLSNYLGLPAACLSAQL